MFIGAGMPPLARLLVAGVPCGLATNGQAANGAQDMFESMKNAAGLAKLAAQDGRALPPLHVDRRRGGSGGLRGERG